MITPEFEIFLHRARRHWMAWTILEHAGLGLLCGCCFALLLLPILLWRQEPAWSIAIVFPLLGAAGGSIFGFRRRPILRAVARLADERFNTADLLATALELRGSTQPWHLNILKSADAYSLGMSPALLTPHRLGSRAWSGIMLALTAVISLGLLSSTLPLNRTEAGTPSVATDGWRNWENSSTHASQSFQSLSPAAREARAEATRDSQSIQSTDAASQDGGSTPKSNRSPREGQADAGIGGGSGRTDSSRIALLSEHAGSSTTDSVADRAIAAGGAGAGVHIRSDDNATSGRVSPVRSSAIAPWSSSNWPAAQAAAVNAIHDGQIPDAYRNLVGDYFQNQSDQIDKARHQ